MTSFARALVVYVDRHAYLIHQTVALYESLLFSRAEDTELVCFGPPPVLECLPKGPRLRKLPQDPHVGAAEYPYLNSIACFAGPGSDGLDEYEHVLKTDVDTFVTPAWNRFRPAEFVCGRGAYVHSQAVRDHLHRVAEQLGLRHEGRHNLGSTLYGTPARVKQVCALATDVTRHLLATEFHEEPGAWPEWFRGVSSMYATEIAMNHLEPHLLQDGESLDFPSHQDELLDSRPHIHCWHTTAHYSKLNWIDGFYRVRAEAELDLRRVPDYGLAMAQRARARGY